MNYNLSIDLKKITGAFLTNIKGQKETKPCICIPLDNDILHQGAKGVYMNATLYECPNNQYGNTHFAKLQVSKERFASMSDAEKNVIPIIGNVKPLNPVYGRMEAQPIEGDTSVENESDLPF